SPALPDTPTVREAGVPGYEAGSWWGIVAPAGTPPDVVEALNNEITKALSTEQMIKFFESEGAEALPGSPKQFGDLIPSELVRWRTGAARVALVGNSRGGYAIRNYLKNGGAADVSHVVLLGVPNHGVWATDDLPGSEFNGNGKFLQALNAGENEVVDGVQFLT